MAEDKNSKKRGFFKGMKAELKKVIWPTGEQTVKSTFATIAFVIMVSLVLIVFNLIFNKLSSLWINSLKNKDVINNPTIVSGEVSGELSSGNEGADEPETTEEPTESVKESGE